MTREACWGCIPGEPRVDQDTLDFDTTCVAKRRALYIVYIYIMAVGVVQVGMLIAYFVRAKYGRTGPVDDLWPQDRAVSPTVVRC